MKIVVGAFIVFFGVFAQAGACELISGAYETTTKECHYSHDGKTFYPEGYKKITLSYDQSSMKFDVDMASDGYSLQYIADGKEQNGRPSYEGNKYIAQCEDNYVNVRGEFDMLKYPLIKEFTADEDTLVYKESFEGNDFVRVCEMDRLIE